MSKNTITFIVGPTATGKSGLAHKMALLKSGAVVNADSVQVFKSLDIGTAKPTQKDQQEVQHLLFDIVEPGGEYTAGQYRDFALKVIEDYLTNKPLFFVGGSGFYVQALDRGMFDVGHVDKAIIDRLQKQLETHGPEFLFEKLTQLDKEYSEKISSNDSYRIVRALSLIESEGRSMTEIQTEFLQKSQTLADTYNVVKVGLYCDRDELRKRVRARCEDMLEQGWLEEVQSLLAQDLKDWTALKSVGYKECLEFLNGKYDRSTLVDEVVKNTMRLAKRQLTWFKRDQSIKWFDTMNEMAQAEEFLKEKVKI